jgi:hypothetical protein
MSNTNTFLSRNFIGMQAQSINMTATNMSVNSQINGSITLDDINIKGTMNCKLQSSIFNQFDDELLNSKNSKCQADTYGATYGPTYGDTLGTVNCRGAFIGTETTGYIGSTFNSKIDVVSQNQLQMDSLVQDQTVSSALSSEMAEANAKNNTAIPMNMISFNPNMANFSVNSYNTTGAENTQAITDPYFGNLWALTRTGVYESSPTLGNTLYQELPSITQLSITKPNGVYNVQGNLSLDGLIYHFANASIQNTTFTGTFDFNPKGNVLINDIKLPFSNVFIANLSQDLWSSNPNLQGNFQFNSNIIYPSNADPQTISINGNISYVDSQNVVEWPFVSPVIPQIGNANIDFPQSISSVARFSNINANIVYFDNNIMNNSNLYYNSLSPPQYGTFIENIYNNMAIYNDQTNSQNANDFIYINPTNANSVNNNNVQPNLFYGWNLKSSATINTQLNAAQLPNPSNNVYLSTGTDTLSLNDNNATYLLMGPIKAVEFDKQNFYLQYLYCEALFGSSSQNFSAEFRVYRVESPTIIPQNSLVSNVLLTEPSSQNSFIISLSNNNTNMWLPVDTSTNFNLFVYNNISNTNYVYYVIRFINYENTSCILRNLKIAQKHLPNYSIPHNNIFIDAADAYTVDALVDNSYFNPFKLQYNFVFNGFETILTNQIKINGLIQDRNNLILYMDLTTNSNIISGIVSIHGEEIISNLNVSGTKTGGNPNDFRDGGDILINGNVNFWNTDFYKYAWHANLINATVEQLPPITPTLIESAPFSGLSGKLILQCGTPSEYNSITKTYIERPLFDNQLSIMSWKFVPEKQFTNPLLARDFTIRFKYQLYSELRGDFFYFQYSPDLGRTYYDLIKQSGDIKSIKSVALFTNSLWKQAEFYLPGGNTTQYIFRWVFEKDLGVSNGFDIVYLADIGVSYTAPVLVDNNGYTKNYSNEFIGNIVTPSSISSATQPYLLPFPIGNPSEGTGFIGYSINYGSNSMSDYNWGTAARNNSDMYTLVNTYYRRDINPNDSTYPSQTDIQFYKMLDNNGYNGQYTEKVWRMYDINTLRLTLGYPINARGQTSWLDVNASPGFYNGTDMALMSSTQNNQETGADNGLINGEATYLTLGPFDSTISGGVYSDLTTKVHTIQFKYLPNTENGFDLTGVITYDYDPSDGDDETVRSNLIQLLTFNQSFHLIQSDLDLWYNTSEVINVSNIRYYPDKLGIYNNNTPINGWINFSTTIPPVAGNNKRIYVIFFAKDWLSEGSYNDVVLLHDIQFTFQTPSSLILDNSGYLHGNTSGSLKIVSVDASKIVIDIPGIGQKKISLSSLT